MNLLLNDCFEWLITQLDSVSIFLNSIIERDGDGEETLFFFNYERKLLCICGHTSGTYGISEVVGNRNRNDGF